MVNLKPLKVYKGELDSYFFTDKKNRKRGHYLCAFAAREGLKVYKEEEKEKDAETT